MASALVLILLSACGSSQSQRVVEPDTIVVAYGSRVATCHFGDVDRCTHLCAGGHGPSCNNLGAMAEYGTGQAQDRSRALTLYKKACELGAEAGCLNHTRLLATRVEVPPCEPGLPPEPAIAVTVEPPPPASPPPLSETEPPVCTDPKDCKAKCDAGCQECCRTLPGIHISGNVVIHGNVKMFGDVYMYGR